MAVSSHDSESALLQALVEATKEENEEKVKSLISSVLASYKKLTTISLFLPWICDRIREQPSSTHGPLLLGLIVSLLAKHLTHRKDNTTSGETYEVLSWTIVCKYISPLCHALVSALSDTNVAVLRAAVRCICALLRFVFSIVEHPIPEAIRSEANFEAMTKSLLSLMRSSFGLRSPALSMRVMMLRFAELIVCLSAPRSYTDKITARGAIASVHELTPEWTGLVVPLNNYGSLLFSQILASLRPLTITSTLELVCVLQTLRGIAAVRSVYRPLVAETILRFQPETRSNAVTAILCQQNAVVRAVFWSISELQSMTMHELDSEKFSLRTRLTALLQELRGKVVKQLRTSSALASSDPRLNDIRVLTSQKDAAATRAEAAEGQVLTLSAEMDSLRSQLSNVSAAYKASEMSMVASRKRVAELEQKEAVSQKELKLAQERRSAIVAKYNQAQQASAREMHRLQELLREEQKTSAQLRADLAAVRAAAEQATVGISQELQEEPTEPTEPTEGQQAAQVVESEMNHQESTPAAGADGAEPTLDDLL